MRHVDYLILCLALQLGCSTASSDSAVPDRVSTRDSRYCEVIPLFMGADVMRADVWNTIAFNTCPAEEWEALDSVQIAAELGADLVLMNGPRAFIMDAAESDSDPLAVPRRFFGELEMSKLATFEIEADLAFGYDSFGIRRALETGNAWEAFDGFFVGDFAIDFDEEKGTIGFGNEKDEFRFRAEIGIEAALWLA